MYVAIIHIQYILLMYRYDSDDNLLTDQGSRISISNGTLTFSPAAKADEGVITCVATNRIRNSSADILLRVLGT